MNEKVKQQVAAAFKDYLKAKNMSGNEFAKANSTFISTANVSHIVSGKWPSVTISDAIWRNLAKAIGYNLNAWQIVVTQNFNKIQQLCEDAQTNSRMLAVAGYTGAGKTTALRKYAEVTPNVFYVHCNRLMGRKDFLKAIQAALAIEHEGSISDRMRSIISRLRALEQPLLILDDTAKLNDANMLMIQIIYDETEGQAGIVLGGTEVLKKYIDKMAAKDKLGFRELKRRIGYWQRMYRPSKKATTAICVNNGITEPRAIEYIYRQCLDYGSLREMISNASRAAEKASSLVNTELLAGIQVGDHDFEAA